MPQISLKAARVNARHTQATVAKELGVSVTTIKNWESGRTFPKQPRIVQLCELYNVPYDNIKFG